MAGLATIPAYIRTANDENVMEMALVENIQRQDLNSLEIALAYQHLMDSYDLTQERLSERVGKKRTTIANYLRLLKLPAPVQVALQNHEIDMGHARALLALEDPKIQVKFFKDIQQKGYSVRQVEEIVKAYNEGGDNPKQKAPVKKELDRRYDEVIRRFSDVFGKKVKIVCGEKGKGKITLSFDDLEDLKRIAERFS